MRKHIPLLFILALTLPFIGVYGWLKFEKAAVRKSVKHRLMEGIPKDELIQFTFALEDTAKVLNWIHSKEFEYQGEMYDIVTRYYSKDSVKYDLWWDHEETELNKNMLFEHLAVGINPPFQNNEKIRPLVANIGIYTSRETEPISPPPQKAA